MTTLLLLLSTLLLLLPVAFGIWLRRPWNWIAFGLWLVLPLLGIALYVLAGMQANDPNAARTAQFGFILLAGIIGLPWVLISGALFALGLAVRRRSRPKAPPAGGAGGAVQVTSPDGRIIVETTPAEWSRGSWVRGPRVRDMTTGRVLLDLTGSNWDTEVALPLHDSVMLSLRRGPDAQVWRVVLDLSKERFRIERGDGHDAAPILGPLKDLARRLDEVPGGEPPRFAAWRSAFVILIGAILAIAAGVWFSAQQRALVVLDSVPAMPRLPIPPPPR